MSLLDDLSRHPALTGREPIEDFGSYDMVTFHLAVCSAACEAARTSGLYDGMPVPLADALEGINELVLKVAEIVRDTKI